MSLISTGKHRTYNYSDAKGYGGDVIYSGHYITETVELKALARRPEQPFSLQTACIDLPMGL